LIAKSYLKLLYATFSHSEYLAKEFVMAYDPNSNMLLSGKYAIARQNATKKPAFKLKLLAKFIPGNDTDEHLRSLFFDFIKTLNVHRKNKNLPELTPKEYWIRKGREYTSLMYPKFLENIPRIICYEPYLWRLTAPEEIKTAILVSNISTSNNYRHIFCYIFDRSNKNPIASKLLDLQGEPIKEVLTKDEVSVENDDLQLLDDDYLEEENFEKMVRDVVTGFIKPIAKELKKRVDMIERSRSRHNSTESKNRPKGKLKEQDQEQDMDEESEYADAETINTYSPRSSRYEMLQLGKKSNKKRGKS